MSSEDIGEDAPSDEVGFVALIGEFEVEDEDDDEEFTFAFGDDGDDDENETLFFKADVSVESEELRQVDDDDEEALDLRFFEDFIGFNRGVEKASNDGKLKPYFEELSRGEVGSESRRRILEGFLVFADELDIVGSLLLVESASQCEFFLLEFADGVAGNEELPVDCFD